MGSSGHVHEAASSRPWQQIHSFIKSPYLVHWVRNQVLAFAEQRGGVAGGTAEKLLRNALRYTPRVGVTVACEHVHAEGSPRQ